MDTAEPRHQVKPHCTVSFEVGELVRIDLVTQVTSNHPVVLQRKVERAPREFPAVSNLFPLRAHAGDLPETFIAGHAFSPTERARAFLQRIWMISPLNLYPRKE